MNALLRVDFKIVLFLGLVLSLVGYFLEQKGFSNGVFPLEWSGMMMVIIFWSGKEFDTIQTEQEMIKRVPLLLSQASLLMHGPGMKGLITLATSETYAPLNKVFKRILQLQQQGMLLSDAFLQTIQEYPIRSVQQLLRWLYYAEVSGYPVQSLLREQAKTLFEQLELQQERQNAVMIEKYTLLACAALLIPFIAGSLSGMTSQLSGLSVMSWNETDSTNVQKQSSDLMSVIQLGSFWMRMEIALMVCVFVALLDGTIRKTPSYAAIILPVSLIIFNIASAGQ